MMKAADFRQLNPPSQFRPLNSSRLGGVALKRQMTARPVIVVEVLTEHAAQVLLVEHNDVIQALAPDHAAS